MQGQEATFSAQADYAPVGRREAISLRTMRKRLRGEEQGRHPHDERPHQGQAIHLHLRLWRGLQRQEHPEAAREAEAQCTSAGSAATTTTAATAAAAATATTNCVKCTPSPNERLILPMKIMYLYKQKIYAGAEEEPYQYFCRK